MNTKMRNNANRSLGAITLKIVGACFGLFFMGIAYSQANTLKNINFSALSGDRVQINLEMTEPASEPVTFTMNNPARVALDFPQTLLDIPKRSIPVGVGIARSINAVEAQGRTRVILNLAELVPFETKVQGNTIYLILEGGGGRGAGATNSSVADVLGFGAANRGIVDIDFRRGNKNEGRVVITLSDSDIHVNTEEEGGKIVLAFQDAILPESLELRLDVTDFATPVQMVDTFNNKGDVRMEISPVSQEYEYLSYQAGDIYTVEFRFLSAEEKEEIQRKKFQYTGERLSLNFQDIEVRAVLQLLADFTDINMVTSDTVRGNITLRLKNTPWDQALDIILKTKGLSKRKAGNVMLIAPTEEIAAREKLELEATRQVEELAPLKSEFVQINYAKASDLAELLKNADNRLLSERGSVTVDERTNTLLVQDTASKQEDVRKIVARLDIPVRQVLIEARIVNANSDFSKELGVRFGVTGVRENGSQGVTVVDGSLVGADTVVDTALTNLRGTGQPFPVDLPALGDRLNVDLPATGAAGQIALAILGKDILLDLELSALQQEGRGEIISTPRVITSDQNEAIIKEGVEIPFLQASAAGNTNVAFKEAVLKLQVTPQITPDDRIIMELEVNQDTADFANAVLGTPPINTREITTTILIDNGETVVLGGVYEQTKTENITGVPFLKDIPLIGHLFRNTSVNNNQRELLIFVTPKIIKSALSLN